MAFDAKGTRIATGCYDKKLRVIDAESGLVLREVEHGGTVRSVAFDAKGTRIATGCLDGKVRALTYRDSGAELGISLTACVAWLVDHAESARVLDAYMRAFPKLGAAVLPALFGGGSLLHCMVAFTRPEWLPCLVECGCDLLFMDAKGRTALDLALEMRDTTVARAMIADLQLSPRVYLSDSFAGTLARLVCANIPCESLLQLSPVPDAQVPARAVLATPRTTIAAGCVLPDYSAIAPSSRRGEADVPVEVLMCKLPGLFDPVHGFLSALTSTSVDELFENEVVRMVVTHKWNSYGKAFFLLRYIASTCLVALHWIISADSFADASGRGERSCLQLRPL